MKKNVMNKLIVSLIISLIFSLTSFAQVQTGKPKKPADANAMIGIQDMQMIEQMMFTVPGVGSNARTMLTSQSVKPYMMPVRKVGYRGSELSYALATCLEFYVNLNKNYKVNLSPDFIKLSIENAGKAVSLEEAFLFLVQNGTVSAAIMPYDSPALTSAVYATQKFNIQNYLHIFRPFTKERQKVFEVRKALMRGNPVLVKVNANANVKALSGQSALNLGGAANETFTFIVVGYDEGENAFELMSSWGSTWGNSGYAWVSYDDFGKYATDGFVMLPQIDY
jgi:hypothetical protein